MHDRTQAVGNGVTYYCKFFHFNIVVNILKKLGNEISIQVKSSNTLLLDVSNSAMEKAIAIR